MRQKGQVSIEFILILVFALIYISGFVWPLIEDSSGAAADIKAVADAKVSAMKLANAVDEAGSSPGEMKKTIKIFLPSNTEIVCHTAAGSEGIEFNAIVSPVGGGWNPDEDNCTEVLDPVSGELAGFECSSTITVLTDYAAGLAPCPVMRGPLFRDLAVEKGDSGIITASWG